MSEPAGIPVELGLGSDGEPTHTYYLLPQRHAKLLRRLLGKKGVFSSFEEFADLSRADDDGEVDFEKFLHVSEGKLYEVLSVFIPDLMPRWEFEGFGSEKHMADDEYDEGMDRSPTGPQIEDAFQAAIQVNGLKWVKKLTGFFDPAIVRAEANAGLARWLRENARPAIDGKAEEKTTETKSSGRSASSPPPNGGSAPTSSGTSETTRSPSSKPEAEAAPTTA